MIRGKDLKRIGFVEGKALGLALEIVEKEYSALSVGERLALLKQVLENPASYLNDTKLSPLALALQKPHDDTIALNIEPKSYQIYGAEAIEEGALSQMETAMKLPVTVAGALMPTRTRDTVSLLAACWLPKMQSFPMVSGLISDAECV